MFILSVNLSQAQDKSFFASGYLLYCKDTTWCRIWLDPEVPYFKSELTVWLNEEVSKIISLTNNDNLTGFGITEKGYEQHLGKINADLPYRKVTMYVNKLVTGAVEIYRHVYQMVVTNRTSLATKRDNYENYYIGRTDTGICRMPGLLRSFSVKKISAYLNNFPEMKTMTSKNLTPEELILLVNRYNEWCQQNKQHGD